MQVVVVVLVVVVDVVVIVLKFNYICPGWTVHCPAGCIVCGEVL